jgi:hypothetical protein
VSGGQVTIVAPLAPPINAVVDSYAITISSPAGIRAVQAPTTAIQNAGPLTSGTATFSYTIQFGFAADRAIPAASVIFLATLIGLYFTRAKTEAEEEEVTVSEQAADMIKAFEEKTDLINSMFEQVRNEDPNNLNKAYFDELRQRLGTFRGRAMQRLNEARQRTASRKLLDLLNHIAEVEKEVDTAVRDLLNLYEQHYTRRMREDTFERLLPNYKRRYDTALNHLSDQLNVAQREAKVA